MSGSVAGEPGAANGWESLSELLSLLAGDQCIEYALTRVRQAGRLALTELDETVWTRAETRDALDRLLDMGLATQEADEVVRRDKHDELAALHDRRCSIAETAVKADQSVAGDLIRYLLADVPQESMWAVAGDDDAVEVEFLRMSRQARVALNAYPVTRLPVTVDDSARMAASDIELMAEVGFRPAGFDIVDKRRLHDPAERFYFTVLSTTVGADISHADRVPLRVSVIDGASLVLPIDPENHVRGFRVTRDATAVDRATSYLLGTRQSACALRTQERPVPLRPALRSVVRLMAAGEKDEAIARKLHVSDRTVRRLVAELLEIAGVDSRFQLALEAARRGWLDDQ